MPVHVQLMACSKADILAFFLLLALADPCWGLCIRSWWRAARKTFWRRGG